jgi:GTPase
MQVIANHASLKFNEVCHKGMTALVAYSDNFRLDEGKSLSESSEITTTIDCCQIAKIFTQKYLNHSQYGLGSGKAEEIKAFVRECKIDKITVDEHFHFKTDS